MHSSIAFLEVSAVGGVGFPYIWKEPVWSTGSWCNYGILEYIPSILYCCRVLIDDIECIDDLSAFPCLDDIGIAACIYNEVPAVVRIICFG